MRFITYCLPALAFVFWCVFGSLGWAELARKNVHTQAIEQFEIGSDQIYFGPLIFRGGLQISVDDESFGGLSAIRLRDNLSDFVAISDRGYWVSGRLQRNGAGQMVDLNSLNIKPLLDRKGRPLKPKHNADAEGLEIAGEHVYVSFEHNARILGYPAQNYRTSPALKALDYVIPSWELRRNGGMETLARAPHTSPLNGALITIAERSVDKRGALFGAILEGRDKGVFFIKRDPPFNITDADFLPNGDLILLERRFSMLNGVGMRLRLIEGDKIRKNALLDGPVLIDVDSRFAIDNMEGINVFQNEKGQIILTLISDDNFSFLQRNLILEFELKPELIPSN